MNEHCVIQQVANIAKQSNDIIFSINFALLNMFIEFADAKKTISSTKIIRFRKTLQVAQKSAEWKLWIMT